MQEKFNWSTVIGCVIVSIGIIIAGYSISKVIEEKPNTDVPDLFEIYNPSDNINFGDFLDEYEAARYLKIDDDSLAKLIREGKLDGMYTTMTTQEYDNENDLSVPRQIYIFSKTKLSEYMNSLIGSNVE